MKHNYFHISLPSTLHAQVVWLIVRVSFTSQIRQAAGRGGDKAGLESNMLDLQAAVVADTSALNWTDKANLELNLHSLI